MHWPCNAHALLRDKITYYMFQLFPSFVFSVLQYILVDMWSSSPGIAWTGQLSTPPHLSPSITATENKWWCLYAGQDWW